MSEVAERTAKANGLSRESRFLQCEERQREAQHAVEEAIRRRIEKDGRHAFYFSEVSCECSSGVLKVRGRVCTDRLKSAFWSLIRGIDDMPEIDDQLDVVSSTGLSSVRPE